MRCQAAVLPGVGEVDLDPPRAGDVLVRIAVAGICHSADHFATGDPVNVSKQLKGVPFGGLNPRTIIPRLLSLYRAGVLKLDELVTRRYRASTALHDGRNIRGIIGFAAR